jgi:hypothetical protein
MPEDVQELTAMMFRYCDLFDTAEYDAFAALFEHGEWHTAGPGAPAARRWIDENVVLYDGLPRTKHVTTNVVIEVADDRASAVGSAYVTVFQSLPGFPLQPILVGRYRDRFARVDGAWRWARREVVGDLYGDLTHHVRKSRGPQR